jgi:hypothetical protein
MPAWKDKNKRYEFTEDNPYENDSPTWMEIDAYRLDGESDRPGESSQDAELLDGRVSSGGKTGDYQYVVRDTEEGAGTEVETLISADDANTPVWFRETPLQSGFPPLVIGGVLGCVPRVERAAQGQGGYRVHRVRLSMSDVNAGTLIAEDPNYSGS